MDKVSFKLDDAKVKLVERSRGRMKIQIKLSKEESEGFKNFCKLRPPELDEETFYKQIFFAGCNAMSEQIQALISAHKQAQQEERDPENVPVMPPMDPDARDLISPDDGQPIDDEQTEEQLQDQ
jgi:hypothetical protein